MKEARLEGEGLLGSVCLALWHLNRPEPDLLPQELPPEMMAIVMDEYLGNSSYGQDRQEAFQELLGDVVFSFPIYDFSKKLQGKLTSVSLNLLPISAIESGFRCGQALLLPPGCLPCGMQCPS